MTLPAAGPDNCPKCKVPYEVGFGDGGVVPCYFCGGRGHRIGTATTTAAECHACNGTGELHYVRFTVTPADPKSH